MAVARRHPRRPHGERRPQRQDHHLRAGNPGHHRRRHRQPRRHAGTAAAAGRSRSDRVPQHDDRARASITSLVHNPAKETLTMLSKRLITLGVLAVCTVASTTIRAAELVPFKGTWTGLTLSADPTGFPIISIVSAGGGTVSHLGDATMISPHTTNVFTGDTEG